MRAPIKPEITDLKPDVKVQNKSSSLGEAAGAVKVSGKSFPVDIFSKNAQLNQFASTSALIKQTLVSFGLSYDNLNKAIFIFSRFFSLPLSQRTGQSANSGGLLAELRRDVLNSLQTENIGEVEEAKALAAVVLADKGVKLTPDAFEAYMKTLFLEPDAEESGDNTGNRQNGKSPNGSGQGQSEADGQKQNSEKEQSSNELRALYNKFMNLPAQPSSIESGESSKKLQLIQFLNSIPGKNSQRWIVWPFSSMVSGIQLKVLVRLLLTEPLSSAQGRLIVDVAAPENSWRFILNKLGKDKLKVNISVFPERKPSALKALKKEAEKLLVMLGPVEIEVSSGGKFPSLADFLEKESFAAVNEEA